MVKKQAVDVSPMRRAAQALYYMTVGARNAAMKNHKSISETLADEIMNCEKASPNSYAIKKKDEIEKVAKGNRWFFISFIKVTNININPHKTLS